MKRLLLTVFAAALTAAIAAPAMAGDITLSGQLRLRGEYRNNAEHNDDIGDSRNYWAQRIRLTANGKATDDVTVKATLQDTRFWGNGALMTDTLESPDFHEAYLNVTNVLGQPVAFRAGRQELSYGDERLIGAFGWSNYGRAFDGFKLMYSTDAVNLDLFAAKIAEGTGVATNSVTGATTLSGDDTDTEFSGAYVTLKQLIPNNTLDVYILDKNDRITSTTRYTIGARLKGSFAGVDYTAELPYQTGEANDISSTPGIEPDVDQSGWAMAVKGSYAIPSSMNLKVGAEYDYATGDDTATTTENEAFDQLYPTNHDKFGYGDFTTATNRWSDLSAWSVNASADLNEKTKVYLAYWDYTQVEPPAGASDELGSAVDITATYKYNSALTVEAGVSRFMPGEATVGVGNPDDPQDWAYLQFLVNF